jgi:hypothetical protein
MIRASFAALVLLTTAMGGQAAAQTAKRMEGGFFGRFAVGLSVVRDLVSIEPSEDEAVNGVVVGVGTSVEWNFGWVAEDGIALGLYVVTDTAQSGDADFGDLDVLVSDAYSLSNVGLFMTYYPEPAGNWYMTGGVGVGTALSIEIDGDGPIDPDQVNPDAATGLGAFFAGGHEWRISRGWSMGASVRVQVIDGSDRDMSIATHRSVGLAALGTVSFN